MNAALVLAAISLALSVVLFFYFRWYMRFQQKRAAQELLDEYRLEVQGLIADINLATDRDSLLVEERIKTLKKLLEDTDKRIAVYVNELERGRSAEALYSKLGQDFRRAAPSSLVDERRPAAPADIATAIAAPETAAPQPPGQGETAHQDSVPIEKHDLRMRIAELAVEGHGAADIASKLKISVSEVELVLRLLRK